MVDCANYESLRKLSYINNVSNYFTDFGKGFFNEEEKHQYKSFPFWSLKKELLSNQTHWVHDQ